MNSSSIQYSMHICILQQELHAYRCADSICTYIKQTNSIWSHCNWNWIFNCHSLELYSNSTINTTTTATWQWWHYNNVETWSTHNLTTMHFDSANICRQPFRYEYDERNFPLLLLCCTIFSNHIVCVSIFARPRFPPPMQACIPIICPPNQICMHVVRWRVKCEWMKVKVSLGFESIWSWFANYSTNYAVPWNSPQRHLCEIRWVWKVMVILTIYP